MDKKGDRVIKVKKSNKFSIYKNIIKRPMDFFMSLIAIILLSPVLIVVGLLVRIKLGSPVIFTQKRPGINKQLFNMYKFRTMTDEKDAKGNLLIDNLRLTNFGRILRSTSLDELPELFNILKGNMSFVGPRPQLLIDMLFMTEDQKRRYSIYPGLTGWAQINGRNNLTWEEKLLFDLEYISEISFVKDLKILFITVVKVFRMKDITTEGMATSEDFGDYLLRTGRIDLLTYKLKIDELKKY